MPAELVRARIGGLLAGALLGAVAFAVLPARPAAQSARAAGPSGAQPPAADLARRIQAHYATVRDFTADFTLTSTSPLAPKPVVERGSVRVKKPGRMRWIWSSADRKEFVADGLQLYSYFPKDRYVMVTPLPQGDQASTALLFLTGRGDLTRDFTSVVDPDPRPNEWRLTLTPRSKQTDFVSLGLEVDRASFAWRGLVLLDDQGGISAFRFDRLKENTGVTDREFEFAIPHGVEIRR
jgi:outer membrane lipoprotein carrier protein